MQKRIMLYFNTDIEIERLMWEYINQNGKNRKSYTIKKLIEKELNKNVPSGTNLETEISNMKAKKELNLIKTSEDVLDIDDADEAFS